MPGQDSLRIGFFGKIPALGDFVTRDLARQSINSLDDWLQHGLAALQHSRHDWLENYLVAPVWQFCLPAGTWGASACCGLLMPSVDRVGRYFPLVVCAELPAPSTEALRPLCSRLANLSARLPEVLHQALDPEQIMALLAEEPWQESPVLPALLDNFRTDGDRSLWWAKTRADLPFRQVSHRGALDDDLAAILFGGSTC